jgi:HEAT repeat protein
MSDPHPHAAVDEAIALLGHARSPKRRAGAKRLRRLRDPRACPALLEALQREVRDRRTWETQYHLIMALAECGCPEALPYLRDLAEMPFEATMIYTALGDALVRLGRDHPDDPMPVLDLLWSDNEMLIDGAFRAVAMLRLSLSGAAVREIIAFVSALDVDHQLRFWVAAAAAGWRGTEVEAFLRATLTSRHEEWRRAAQASLEHRYLAWRPL